MALAVRRDDRMSVAEYRVWVEAKPDEEHWELLDGVPVLMAPASERHSLICFNLARSLAGLVEPKGCRALQGLGVLNDFIDDFAPLPDVVVRCGPLLRDGYARDPVLVAEVLSPSTMNNDRGRKFSFYKLLQTLSTVLLIYQSEARIEVWRRDGADWDVAIVGLDGTIDLPEFGSNIDVATIYANTTIR